MAINSSIERKLRTLLGDSDALELIDILNATQALSGAEAGYIDGVTAGTALASKAVVLDANKDVASLRDVTVRNIIATGGVGVVAGSGITAVEYGDGSYHRTVLTLTNAIVALTDEAGVVAYGGRKVYDFPEGAILFLGATANLAITKSSLGVNADWDGDFGLGSVTASNDDSLASTEQDMIPSTPTPQADTGATTAKGASTSTESSKVFDGTTDALDAFINLLVDDLDHDVTATPCNLILNGTITLSWANLGDF